MGQASSRGSPGASRSSPTPRDRPASWAPSQSPQQPQQPPQQLPPDDAVPEGRHSRPRAPRPVSQRLNPLALLAARRDHHDAGSSGTDGGTGAASDYSHAHVCRRRSRLSRARDSLSALPTLLHRRRRDLGSPEGSPASPSSAASPPPARQVVSTHSERSPGLPQLQVPELRMSFDDVSEAHGSRPLDIPLPRHAARGHGRGEGRAASIIPSFRRPERGLRNMTNSLRPRQSPAREEDQAAMLSRLLSVAAAATAASLMGDDQRPVAEPRSIPGGEDDGTFDGFLQSLQNGRIASALRQSHAGGDLTGDSPDASPAPLNFFRMFRFGATGGDQRSEAPDDTVRSGSTLVGSQGADEQDRDSRLVPIIIVGIRSISPGSASHEDHIPPFLDALSTFPAALPAHADNEPDYMRPQPQQRFSHRRRASMGGANTFPANYDSQRHYRAPDRVRPWSTISDSPAGPLPPPSTPASSGLSAISSGTNTPVLSTSPPSPTTQSSAPSRRGSSVRRPLEPTAEGSQAQPRIPRQRRMSDPDFTTRFGSGSSRRNGVVEPDHNPGEGSRSWIIYVLGGSYPENHPILTTPSLFTDSPTYEDMMLLSTLLGPAKPPVASEEDVAAAPGLLRIHVQSGKLVAQAVDGNESINLVADTRCLVCLSDFEVDEEARKLVSCGHLFHKICIDQWLTTGRNSCPLCRGKGVEEQSAPPDVPENLPSLQAVS